MHTYIFDMLFEMEYNKEKNEPILCKRFYSFFFYWKLSEILKNQIKYIQV